MTDGVCHWCKKVLPRPKGAVDNIHMHVKCRAEHKRTVRELNQLFLSAYQRR